MKERKKCHQYNKCIAFEQTENTCFFFFLNKFSNRLQALKEDHLFDDFSFFFFDV